MSKCSTSAIHSTNAFLRATDTSDLSAEQTVGPREVVCSPLCWRASTGRVLQWCYRGRRTDGNQRCCPYLHHGWRFRSGARLLWTIVAVLGSTIVADSVNTFY